MNRDEMVVKFPRALSEKYNVVPKEDGINAVNFWTVTADENIRMILKIIMDKNVEFEVVDEITLQEERNIFYKNINNKLVINLSSSIEQSVNKSFESSSEISEALNEIINFAITNNASDIHFDSCDSDVVIRIRIDGILSDISRISKYHYGLISTRIKILANLDYTIKNIPLDGRFTFSKFNKSTDIRVAVTPTAYGEKIVLRILDKTSVEFTMNGIGLFGEDEKLVKKLLRQPSGLLLVCGPTGSGKSSTLYTMLKLIASRDINIITVEDPVEYKLNGINQIEINSELGRTFNEELKSILRLDPDKIMVGEIRDKETAQTALRAAITGNFVISTIHTSDSPSAIYRLKDMGIENYLISAGLIGVMSQRLVRKLCDCSTWENQFVDIFEKQIRIKKPQGCEKCRNGYVGRTAVFEILPMNNEIKEAIVKEVSIGKFNEICRKNMVSLKTGMEQLLESGVTSLDEIYKNIISIGDL